MFVVFNVWQYKQSMKVGQKPDKIKLLLIQPHGLCFAATGLGSNDKGPAIIVNMPVSVNEIERGCCTCKIGPGSHGSRIAIPGPVFFYGPVFYSVNSLVAVVLKFIPRKISGDVGAVLGKTGNSPLPVGHCFYDIIFLEFFDRLFTARKQEDQTNHG